LDPGESFANAAVRETLEEAGVEIELTGILRIEVFPFLFLSFFLFCFSTQKEIAAQPAQ
jgi:8-oxo-dGTP pyrophosphatase MutT (NUDIX family)